MRFPSGLSLLVALSFVLKTGGLRSLWAQGLNLEQCYEAAYTSLTIMPMKKPIRLLGMVFQIDK